MEIESTETIKQAVIAGMGISFLSAHTISQELQAGSLAVLDVQGFPLMLNWYVVHRRNKRLPPVAQAFKDFLLRDGASLIAQIVPFDPPAVSRAEAKQGLTSPFDEPPEIGMNDENFNISLRKFLKMVGVSSQREIEQAVPKALAGGGLQGKTRCPPA